MIGYTITSKGDLATKLQYAFELYDADNNGYLTPNEVQEVLAGMLDLLGADKKTDLKALTAEVMKQLDSSHDGKVSKDEFVKGLMANYSIRYMISHCILSSLINQFIF